MFFAGLDIHKEFIYGTVLDSKGKVVNQGRFGTTEKEVDDFFGFLPNKQLSIVLESCGIWEDFYDLLESKGYKVCLANPLQVKAIASARSMSGRTSLEIKKEILSALQDGKAHSYAELERKVNSNWQTVRNHSKELEIFSCVKIQQKKSHERNNKPYFEVSITKQGRNVLKKL